MPKINQRFTYEDYDQYIEIFFVSWTLTLTLANSLYIFGISFDLISMYSEFKQSSIHISLQTNQMKNKKKQQTTKNENINDVTE